MEFSYTKTKEEVKTVITDEIKGHKKYEIYNEILGSVEDDKIRLFVQSEIAAPAGTFFKNYFYAKITETEEGCALKGRFSMKPLSLILLAILFLICVETIVFNLVLSKFAADIIPAAVILISEAALLIIQYINAAKEKKILLSFLNVI